MNAITQNRIIDNKKISLTQAEWDMFGQICRSYDRPNFKGEDLFTDLFETDDDGVIIFLKPPTSKFTSIEVYLFVVSIYEHQHMRRFYNQIHALTKEVQNKLKELDGESK